MEAQRSYTAYICTYVVILTKYPYWELTIIGPALQSRNGDDVSYGTANSQLITWKFSRMYADLSNHRLWNHFHKLKTLLTA